jgi:hypothetical protein
MSKPKEGVRMQNRYLLLRAIAILLEIAGVFSLVLGVLGALLFAGAGNAMKLGALAARVPLAQYWRQLGLPHVSAVVAAGITGLAGLLSCLLLYASGELIQLLLDIQDQARDIAGFLHPKA